MRKKWRDCLWVWSIVYSTLGFFNILFAWLGMIDVLVPMFVAVIGGNKAFCNRYCGRGQLLAKLGGDCKCSRNKATPKWTYSKWFRRGFLVFFFTMFGVMIWNTHLVGTEAENLKEVLKLFWSIRVPLGWTYSGSIFPDWVAQFGFGFYSLMLTSTLIGLIVMVLFKPRTWCTFCPIGTMTQEICRIKAGADGRSN